MRQDYEALANYASGKTKLSVLLEEREKRLEELRTLVEDAILISSVNAVYHFDVIRVQELLVMLSEYEVRLFRLADEINKCAALCDQEAIAIFAIPRESRADTE